MSHMSHLPISITIITLNEEANIRRAIESVRWADDILVVDSGSTDRTTEVAKALGARVLTHAWQGYGQQKNFAQQNARHDWVLNLDADEAIDESLHAEIQYWLTEVASERSQAMGFSIPRKTFYLGRWIKHGGWYPNYLIRMADRRASQWSEPHVHEALEVDGEVVTLKAPLLHYAFPSIRDQIVTNLNFSQLGSQELRRRGQQGSLLKLLLKPIGKFIETYFLKAGFLDGLPGFIISVNAAHSMFLKYAYVIESEIRGEAGGEIK